MMWELCILLLYISSEGFIVEKENEVKVSELSCKLQVYLLVSFKKTLIPML